MTALVWFGLLVGPGLAIVLAGREVAKGEDGEIWPRDLRTQVSIVATLVCYLWGVAGLFWPAAIGDSYGARRYLTCGTNILVLTILLAIGATARPRQKPAITIALAAVLGMWVYIGWASSLI